MARPRREPVSKMGAPGKAHVSENRIRSGRYCFWATIRVTSVGRSIWKTNNGWRPMWQCTRVKAAVRQSWELLCYLDCCAAVAAAGNCKLCTAAPADACRATSVGVIEEIANPADA